MQKFPDDILSNIRINLEEEKTKLYQRIDELTAQDPFSDPERVNNNAASDTEASEESDHDRVNALVEELKEQVTRTDEALMRIMNGTYGYCGQCEKMIDTDRLNILPTATLCLACESSKKSKP